MKAGVDVITIDTAHGHSRGVIEKLKEVKAKYPDLQVVVGNIATVRLPKPLPMQEPMRLRWVLVRVRFV